MIEIKLFLATDAQMTFYGLIVNYFSIDSNKTLVNQASPYKICVSVAIQ